MGSHDWVTADKVGKWLALFMALCLRIWLFLGLFWTRFGPLAKSRSGNPGYGRRFLSLHSWLTILCLFGMQKLT